MTFATDQKTGAEGLSETSRRMLELREKVFAEWEARVRADLKQANALSQQLLIDTLPAFYDNIAEALTPDYPRNTGIDGTTLGTEHGGERARLTHYDSVALVGEYRKFRWAMFNVFRREGLQLTLEEVQTINWSIDAGIKDAVAAFILVNGALRERFAAAIAHDLRGPLSTASTALQLIAMSNDIGKARTLAVKALENVERMDHMIHELLDTMAFHSGEQLLLEMSNFNICDLIREVLVARTGAKDKRVDLIGKEVHGWWDRSALIRALENLLSNAHKYGRTNSSITIKVTETHGRIKLSVHNEGDPISPEEQESVFQMYRRTESAKAEQGWGIGLPYVRAVAESHGGSIALDSTAERGTTLTIDIPVDCRPYLGAPTVA